MRDLKTVFGLTLATVSSLALMAACGGGGNDAPAPTTTTTSTTTTTTLPALNFASAQVAMQHSQLCLSEADNNAGTATKQVVCVAGTPAQSWKISSTDGTFYTFVNNASNMCMGVPNSDKTPAAPIQQLACNGADNMLWKLQPSATEGQFNVVNKNSGQCVDITGSEQAPNTAAIQFTCSTNNQPNQRVAITGK